MANAGVTPWITPWYGPSLAPGRLGGRVRGGGEPAATLHVEVRRERTAAGGLDVAGQVIDVGGAHDGRRDTRFAQGVPEDEFHGAHAIQQPVHPRTGPHLLLAADLGPAMLG